MSDDKRITTTRTVPASEPAAAGTPADKNAEAVKSATRQSPKKSVKRMKPPGGIAVPSAGEPVYGGPPTNADGISITPPFFGGRNPLANTNNTDSVRWTFVALPRLKRQTAEDIQGYFNLILLSNLSHTAHCIPYQQFPPHLANTTANVENAPEGSYDLSKYWITVYWLSFGDSIALPTGASSQAGVVAWTRVIFPSQVGKTEILWVRVPDPKP